MLIEYAVYVKIPDRILMMLVMNGYDFCKAIKTDPLDNEREYLMKCLVKPFDNTELFRCIQQYCK